MTASVQQVGHLWRLSALSVALWTLIAAGLLVVGDRPSAASAIAVTETASTPRQPGGQRVVVDVERIRASGDATVLEYWLVVEQREGRWEMADLPPRPPLNTTSVKEKE
jgi:hypothetical protein